MIRAFVALAVSAIPMLAGDTVTVVPEPSSVLLMASGLVAFGYLANRKRRK